MIQGWDGEERMAALRAAEERGECHREGDKVMPSVLSGKRFCCCLTPSHTPLPPSGDVAPRERAGRHLCGGASAAMLEYSAAMLERCYA
jgi:hypothetical protein